MAAHAQRPAGIRSSPAWPSRERFQLGGVALWGCCGSCCTRGRQRLAHHLQGHLRQEGAGLEGTLGRLEVAAQGGVLG